MKRYSQYEGSTYVMEDNSEGEWVRHSDAMEIVEALDKTVDERNEYFEQNKEMLEALKEIYKDCTKHNTEKMRVLIQKVEGE